MSTLRLSHVLHRVTDLHRAVDEAEAAGFVVHWGSDPDRAHNALVWFETGPFLEFFAPPRFDEASVEQFEAVAGPGAILRARRWAGVDDGWCDYAVETDAPDLDAVVARCQASEVDLGPAFEPSRTLPGGDTVTWHLSFPHDGDLPFVMSAYSTRQRPQTISHPNGATEVTSITIAHPDPDSHRRRLARYAGLPTLPDVVVEQGGGPGAAITSVSAAGLTQPVPFGASTLDPAGSR
ncbi:MAG: VOC family protein [Actinomycetota bacterium]